MKLNEGIKTQHGVGHLQNRFSYLMTVYDDVYERIWRIFPDRWNHDLNSQELAIISELTRLRNQYIRLLQMVLIYAFTSTCEFKRIEEYLDEADNIDRMFCSQANSILGMLAYRRNKK